MKAGETISRPLSAASAVRAVKRPFYAVAFLLALIAFIAQSFAQDCVLNGTKLKAKQLQKIQEQHIPIPRPEAEMRLVNMGNLLTYAGLTLSISSVVCMGIAAVRREPGWYLILLLLIGFGFLEPLLL